MMRGREWFKITSVHRDDLICAGHDGDSVDDATMERLAEKMCDDYLEQLFWVQIGIISESLGIPTLDKSKLKE